MGRRLRPPAAPALALAVVAALAGTACGSGRTGGPRGEPTAVVRSSPDRTFAASSAAVEASAADAQSTARVRFAEPPSRLDVRGPGRSSAAYPELADPLAMVDMVRGAVGVVSYGGVSLRGAATFRYELTVDVAQAVAAAPVTRRDEVAALGERLGSPSFYADVWVDDRGRVRRVQVPVDKASRRPGTRDRTMPALVTVDLFDYRPA